jgi:hypothetical protein
MRLDQQNRLSCLLILVLLIGLAGLVIWMALGGIPDESVGDDVKADLQAPAPKPVGEPKG